MGGCAQTRGLNCPEALAPSPSLSGAPGSGLRAGTLQGNVTSHPASPESSLLMVVLDWHCHLLFYL